MGPVAVVLDGDSDDASTTEEAAAAAASASAEAELEIESSSSNNRFIDLDRDLGVWPKELWGMWRKVDVEALVVRALEVQANARKFASTFVPAAAGGATLVSSSGDAADSKYPIDSISADALRCVSWHIRELFGAVMRPPMPVTLENFAERTNEVLARDLLRPAMVEVRKALDLAHFEDEGGVGGSTESGGAAASAASGFVFIPRRAQLKWLLESHGTLLKDEMGLSDVVCTAVLALMNYVTTRVVAQSTWCCRHFHTMYQPCWRQPAISESWRALSAEDVAPTQQASQPSGRAQRRILANHVQTGIVLCRNLEHTFMRANTIMNARLDACKHLPSDLLGQLSGVVRTELETQLTLAAVDFVRRATNGSDARPFSRRSTAAATRHRRARS